MTICPVCLTEGAKKRGAGPIDVRCPNCGRHHFTPTAATALAAQDLSAGDRARLAHGLVKLPEGAWVRAELLHDLITTTRLPPAGEQIDNLLLHLAATLRPGEARTVVARNLVAIVGAVTVAETRWVIEETLAAGWLRAPGGVSTSPDGWVLEDATLSALGWQRHAELVRQGAKSRHAFMAMKFGDAQLDALYREHLRPAVAATGFELRAANDRQQTAGSIDNRMRVEIRTSRFLLCDLTHGNRGAYWEAGFAEGLGRPVFYLCRDDVLKATDAEARPHFDTAHQLIIGWDPAAPAQAMQALKDAIRATLPAEATMEDR
ncbi:MAG: hypothetical protein U1F50_15390 [Rubrivivax sp.]